MSNSKRKKHPFEFKIGCANYYGGGEAEGRTQNFNFNTKSDACGVRHQQNEFGRILIEEQTLPVQTSPERQKVND